MARKRNCEHKSYLTAKGSSLTFVGAAKNPKYDMLKRAIEWALHLVEKGDDLIAYFQDDWYKDELEYLRRVWGKQLGELLLNANIKKNPSVVLSKVLPERLPRQNNRTWEEIYEASLESTERDENGTNYNSRNTGANYESEEDKPDIVRVWSVNEFRVNGHF